MNSEKEKGQGTVEFAIVIPFLLLMLLGIVTLGQVFPFWVAAQNAAAEGARAAAVWRPRVDGTYSCQQAVNDAITGSTPFVYTIEMSANCEGNSTQPIPKNQELWVRTTLTYEPVFWGTLFNPPIPNTWDVEGYQESNHW